MAVGPHDVSRRLASPLELSGCDRCEGQYAAAFRLRIDHDPRSRGGRQAEEELHLWDSSQRKMPDLEHRLPQVGHEFARHDELLADFAAQPLDPAREIDVTADDREIESIARADIAIGDRAVMQCEARDEMGCAVERISNVSPLSFFEATKIFQTAYNHGAIDEHPYLYLWCLKICNASELLYPVCRNRALARLNN